MSISIAYVVANVVLLVLTIGVRAIAVNRLVLRKLLLTLVVALASLVGSALLAAGLVPVEIAGHVSSVSQLLLALGTINFLVVTAINPIREDRIPHKFPNIVQDSIVVGLFAIVATAVLQEKFMTTSAVGAMVVGFALQDTLGNAFAGLAIQTEKPYRTGHWIRIGEHEGRVEEITWRATKLRTKGGTFVIVPNNVMSKQAIVNFSEPIVPTRMTVDVGASYDAPPNEVKAALHEAMLNAPLVLASPEPEVLVYEFGPSSITYRARFWIEDYARDEAARTQVRTAIWYEFRRKHLDIPLPALIQYARHEAPAVSAGQAARIAVSLAEVEVLQSLTEADRLELASMCEERLYGVHEAVVRQGDPGESMFVVAHGQVEIVLEPAGRQLSTTGAGGFFGEMSMLTGNPRTATVRTLEDCTLIEITAEAFRRFVLEKPEVLERIAVAVMERRAEIDRRRAEAARTEVHVETAMSFLGRVRKFLRIPS